MIQRLVNPLKSNSFFLFGARGTGKSTLLSIYLKDEKSLWFDLLNPEVDDRLQRNPNNLIEQIEAQKEVEWVVIDEVQKNPKLLDLVHQLIEKTTIKFALTGSSARKLKRGSSNLLAGRAFVNHLFPLTFLELGEAFDLNNVLNWGSLPKLTEFHTETEKQAFLRAYALTYLKEEVWAEHLIRNLDPFRRFLEIAAQANGEIVNYTNISRDVGADVKTVQSYFEILADTLLGFFLEPYNRSIRKQQRQSPKFYFFDLGVKRSLDRMLTQTIKPNTYAFGKAFEHFIVTEIYRLNSYFNKDFKLSYLLTKDGVEVDLIIERPGLPTVLAEIKSTDNADERDTKHVEHFLKDFPSAIGMVLSLDPSPRKVGNVTIFPWQKGLEALDLF